MIILAIDTQLWGAGWCLLDQDDGDPWAGTDLYDKDHPKGNLDLALQCDWAVAWFCSDQRPWWHMCPLTVCVERPDWLSHPSNKLVDDLSKVAAVAGALSVTALRYYEVTQLVRSRDWKGSKSKDATALEVAAYLKVTKTKLCKRYDQHAVDAIAMALHFRRKEK